MEPSFPVDPKGFACVTGEASVSPYPSTSRPLVNFSNFSCTSIGSGAAPLIQKRMAPRPYDRTFGALFSAI